MSKIFVLTKFRVNKFQFVSLLVISLHVFFFPIYVNIKLVYLFLDNFIRTLHVICIIFDITTIRIKNLPHMEQHHPLLSLDHNLVWYDHSEKKEGWWLMLWKYFPTMLDFRFQYIYGSHQYFYKLLINKQRLVKYNKVTGESLCFRIPPNVDILHPL